MSRIRKKKHLKMRCGRLGCSEPRWREFVSLEYGMGICEFRIWNNQ